MHKESLVGGAQLADKGASRARAIQAALLASWIAAGTFLVAKQTTERFAPLELGWFRITLSFIIIWTVWRLGPAARRVRPARSDFKALLAMGFLGVTGNQLLFLHGIHLAPPIDGALLYAFTPVMVLLGARLFLGESLTWGKVVGIIIALVGVITVLSARGLNVSAAYLEGDLIIALAVLCWAGYTLIGKGLMARYGALTVNTWAFGIGALSVLPFAYQVLGDFDWASPGLGGWLGLFYLSAITSVVSFTLWTFALKALDASQVAVFTNLQPVLTAILTWFFFDQIPTPIVLMGMALVIVGVSLTQLKRKPK